MTRKTAARGVIGVLANVVGLPYNEADVGGNEEAVRIRDI
jgi:hypothetical protein